MSKMTFSKKLIFAYTCVVVIPLTLIVFSIMGFTSETPFYDINFANTGITRVIFYKKGTNPYGDVVFDYINNTEHLGTI